jgi:hypothetical protein
VLNPYTGLPIEMTAPKYPEEYVKISYAPCIAKMTMAKGKEKATENPLTSMYPESSIPNFNTWTQYGSVTARNIQIKVSCNLTSKEGKVFTDIKVKLPDSSWKSSECSFALHGFSLYLNHHVNDVVYIVDALYFNKSIPGEEAAGGSVAAEAPKPSADAAMDVDDENDGGADVKASSAKAKSKKAAKNKKKK